MAEEDIFQGIPLLNIEECRKIVKLRLKSTDTEILKVNTTTFGDTPAGFLGDHYRVIVTVAINKNADGEPNKLMDLHFFVKTIPNSNFHSEFVYKTGINKKEQDFYSILVPKLCKHQISNEHIDGTLKTSTEFRKNNKPSWTSESFLTTSKMLVLDDLSVNEYRTLDTKLMMDYDHCVIVLQTLARFHASSIIFEEKETEVTGIHFCLYDIHPDILKESYWTQQPGHPGKEVFETRVQALSALLKWIPGLEADTEQQNVVYKRMAGLYQEACEFVKMSSEFKNVVTHGDLWANNILFRYNSNKTKPQDARIVDFQLLRYTAPAHDVICFIYLNTRRSFREKYLLDLALAYHVELKAELQRHNLNIENLVPWTQFKASLKHYHGLGVITANLFFTIILIPSETMAEIFASPERFQKFMFIDPGEEVCRSFTNDAKYRERLTESLEELIEYFTQKK